MKSTFLSTIVATVLGCATWQSHAQEAPSITEQPASQAIASGDTALFSVVATGSEPLLYQWFFADASIADATGSSLTISNATQQSAGSYYVVVANDFGSVTSEVATLTVSQSSLDLNGDGETDILWAHPDGRLAGWLMEGTNVNSSTVLDYTGASGWRMAGQADLDQDGKLDFIWHHRNGSVAAWLMDGTNRLGTLSIRQGNAGWRIVGFNDFDDDGSTDILWQHGNGRLAAWYMDGTNFTSSAFIDHGRRGTAGWRVVSIYDADGDDKKDLLWQHASGRLALWRMDGIVRLDSQLVEGKQGPSSAWNIMASADMDGDGKTDLIWQHPDGRVAVWLMDGTARLGTVILNGGDPAGDGWRIVGPK